MAGTGKKWLIGCGVGCGVTILLNIILFVGAGFLFTQPMNKAVGSQKKLAEAYGEPNDYVPGVDSLTPQRMEAFLAVRQVLMPACEEFEGIAGGFAAMDELDSGGDEPSTKEIFQGLGKVMGSVKGLVTHMGEIMELRNEALMEQEMGMGEYTWIYVLAFNSWLSYEPNTGIESTSGGEFGARERSLIEDLLNAHADALAEAGRFEEAEIWRKEVEKMDWSGTGIPFEGIALPREITMVLEAYRSRLEEAYCPPMTEFDLGQIKKRGFSYHSD
jgi:hypothetical protein